MTITALRFDEEVRNLLYADDGNPLHTCMHCAACTASCPAASFMEHSPQRLIAMIEAGMKEEVLHSNTYWMCSSCFACSVRCPRGIHPANLMYGLKRYSIWKGEARDDLVGPDFSRRFVRTIVRNGKSYEPGYAPAFIWEGGLPGVFREMQGALRLMMKGRLKLIPAKIKRIDNFREMINRVLPLDGIS